MVLSPQHLNRHSFSGRRGEMARWTHQVGGQRALGGRGSRRGWGHSSGGRRGGGGLGDRPRRGLARKLGGEHQCAPEGGGPPTTLREE